MSRYTCDNMTLVRGHGDYDCFTSIFFHIKSTQSTLLIPYDDTVLEHSLSNIELSNKKKQTKGIIHPPKIKWILKKTIRFRDLARRDSPPSFTPVIVE